MNIIQVSNIYRAVIALKNSFLSGAVILMTANAISKILGAVFRIPLTYIVHEEGMAVYNTAFSIYVMFLSFIISGMPFAVQKLTAGSIARRDRAKAEATVRAAAAVLSSVGMIGTLIMWAGADFFALAMKEPRAVAAIKAAAPSVFFVACGAAVKSGFQGASDMLPTAVSQVIEAIIKLVAGYALAVMLIGGGTELAAAGAAGGVTIGELAATLMLGLWYVLSHRNTGVCECGRREILSELMSIALPMLCMSVVSSSLSVCDTSLLRHSLLRAGLGEEGARFVYGAYTGYAQTVLNLPAGLLAALGVSIIPIISGAAAIGNVERIRFVTERALTLSASAGMFFAVCLYFMSDDILYILFHNTYSAPMLRLASPMVIFICIMQLSGAALQSMGHLGKPFISSLAAMAVKITLTVILASKSEYNIFGAVFASCAGFFTGAVINLIFISVHTGLKREYAGILLKPGVSAAAAAAAVSFAGEYFVFTNVIARTVFTSVIAFSVFVICLFMLGAVKIREKK